MVLGSNLKSKQGHNNGHPADRHGDVSTPLLSNNIHGAQEEHRPDDVIEHDQTQEGHENPQRHAHHLAKHDVVLTHVNCTQHK